MTGRMQQQTQRGPLHKDPVHDKDSVHDDAGHTTNSHTTNGHSTNQRGSTDGNAATSGDEHAIEDRYNFHDASFRRHYQLHYHDLQHDGENSTGRNYESFYAPAYRFGYELAEEHSGAEWSAVESQAQQHWQSKHNSAWSDVQEAIRYGWQEQRNPESLRVHHAEPSDLNRKNFQQHYNEAMQESGLAFEHLEPAYHYGYAVATDSTYGTHEWAAVEPGIRKYYESEYAEGEVPWEHYRDAVYHSWYTTRAVG